MAKDAENEKSRYHIKAHGKVQGVFYRAFAKDSAERLGIRGFARNNPDGSVEIIAEGRNEDLKSFARHLKKGPPSSRVEHLEIRKMPYDGEFSRFEIILGDTETF